MSAEVTTKTMSTDLVDLIEFLHHGNTQIRQVATKALIPYSTLSSSLSLFKANSLEPLKDLKLLIRDYPQIAEDAITILVNLTSSSDSQILETFSRDAQFTEQVLRKIIDDITEPNADLCCGLLANLVKDDTLAKRLLTENRTLPPSTMTKIRLRANDRGEVEATKTEEAVSLQISTSPKILDQLMDVFVKGANNTLNSKANYDYLSYVFADLSKFDDGRDYLLEEQEYDNVVPITKLVVFTEHGSLVRRKGVASTIKNCAFEVEKHSYLLKSESEQGVGLLPYLLLPLAGNEEFDAEDSEGMIDELQLLPPDKEREVDDDIIATHVETLLLLTTERDGREVLRKRQVYPVIRELHLKREAEGIAMACERLVDVLMRDEMRQNKLEEIEEGDDDDYKVEEVF